MPAYKMPLAIKTAPTQPGPNKLPFSTPRLLIQAYGLGSPLYLRRHSVGSRNPAKNIIYPIPRLCTRVARMSWGSHWCETERNGQNKRKGALRFLGSLADALQRRVFQQLLELRVSREGCDIAGSHCLHKFGVFQHCPNIRVILEGCNRV
jgi:hypothetical protein